MLRSFLSSFRSAARRTEILLSENAGTISLTQRSQSLTCVIRGWDVAVVIVRVIVLVVEDEALIRFSLVAGLEDAGFTVFEAAKADEALELLAAHPEIQAIFTDIDMPGSMDGLELARHVKQSRPDMLVLITSGFLKVAKRDLPTEIRYFSKPYDVGSVVKHILERTAR